MARAEGRWMPMNWSDYWRDTGHLSATEHGAYLNLIGAYWTAGAALVNNAAWLQRLAKCTAKEWQKVSPTILAFFEVRGDKLHHKRIDAEMEIAKQRYERRASAGRTGGEAKAKQNASNATAHDVAKPGQCHTHTTLVQSPNGDDPPSGDSPRPVKAHRLSPDWKPNPEGQAYARERNLTDDEIADIALPKFIRIFTGPDLRKPLRKGWDRTWKNFVDDEAPKIVGNRARASKPGANQGHRGSVTTARDQILAKAGIQPPGGDHQLRVVGESRAAGDSESDRDYGPIIDADYRERGAGFADGTEGVDAPTGGADDSGYRGPDGGISEAAADVPSGRSSPRIGEPAEPEPVVAVMAGTSREAGDSHLPPPDDADGLAIPEFLKRTA